MMEAVCGTSSALLIPTQPFDPSLNKTSKDAPHRIPLQEAGADKRFSYRRYCIR